jgi:uncharacterized YigZ family protein
MDDRVQRLVPLAPVETEIRVVNSRFIASLSPANSVEEARAFVAEIKKRFPDATHHVPAFVIGHGQSIITHCTDDGEPLGTAGRPALAVLQGSGLGNVVVVVTRYFGGTKLGTGGLVKAYGESVKAVLEHVQLADLVPTTTIMFSLPYSLYELGLRAVEACNGIVLQDEFAVDVTLTVQFQDSTLEEFKSRLTNLTSGQVDAIVIDENPNTPFPVAGFG